MRTVNTDGIVAGISFPGTMGGKVSLCHKLHFDRALIVSTSSTSLRNNLRWWELQMVSKQLCNQESPILLRNYDTDVDISLNELILLRLCNCASSKRSFCFSLNHDASLLE